MLPTASLFRADERKSDPIYWKTRLSPPRIAIRGKALVKDLVLLAT